jgi:methionine-rich copper-binding protein CopC
MLPAANAILQEAPHEITIRFSERVEPHASSYGCSMRRALRLDDVMAAVVP